MDPILRLFHAQDPLGLGVFMQNAQSQEAQRSIRQRPSRKVCTGFLLDLKRKQLPNIVSVYP